MREFRVTFTDFLGREHVEDCILCASGNFVFARIHEDIGMTSFEEIPAASVVSVEETSFEIRPAVG